MVEINAFTKTKQNQIILLLFCKKSKHLSNYIKRKQQEGEVINWMLSKHKKRISNSQLEALFTPSVLFKAYHDNKTQISN